MKKIIAFDQDDTLNITKLPVDSEMAGLLAQLLAQFKVCVISGTGWETMKTNDVEPLMKLPDFDQELFMNYYILPTTGTQFWRWVGADFSEEKLKADQELDDGWLREYAHFLSEEQVEKIFDSIERAAKKLGYWRADLEGDNIIENRGSQVTYSALGQWADPADKYKWDPDLVKRKAIVAEIEPELKDLGIEITIGGTTSIDVTLPGIDKAYGMRQLMEQTGTTKEDILFIGDKLQPGGNDFPVRDFGIDTIEVHGQEDTKWVLRGILGVMK